MKKLLLSAIAAWSFLAVYPVYAAPLINIGACSPEPCTVSTNLTGFTPNFPAVSFGPTTVGAFSINGSSSVPVNGSLISDVITVSTTTGGTIKIDVSGTGATGLGPGTTLTSSFTSNSQAAATSHSADLLTFFDINNGLFDQNSTTPGNLLSSATLTSANPQTAGPFAVTRNTGSGLVSVAEEYDVTLTGCTVALPCNANLTIDLTATPAAVREPASLAILGSALAMLGWIGLRRRRSGGTIAAA